MTTQPKPNTVAERKPTATIKSIINGQEFRAQVERALPKHLSPDRFIRVALTTMMRTPKLATCDQASFLNSLLTLSQLGLEPDGRRAHLIPFNNTKRGCVECQLIVDYKGIVELVMRTGLVSNLHASSVCENDEFEYDCGEIKRHRINFKAPRGEPYAYYCLCRFKDGGAKAEVMDIPEIHAIRNRSQGYLAAKAKGWNHPWMTDEGEMSKKTVFKRLSKWLQLSSELREAIDLDDEPIAHESHSNTPKSLVEVVRDFEPESVDVVQDDVQMEDEGTLTEPVKEAKEQPPQAQIAEIWNSNFQAFQEWCVEGGSFPQCDSVSRFSEIPTADAVRLLRGKSAMVKASFFRVGTEVQK